jgi:hypothetical protein
MTSGMDIEEFRRNFVYFIFYKQSLFVQYKQIFTNVNSFNEKLKNYFHFHFSPRQKGACQ